MLHTINNHYSSELFVASVLPIINEIYKSINCLLKNRENSEDALQNTLAIAFLHFNKVRDMKSFNSWIFKIARNEAIKIIKHNKKYTCIAEDFNNRFSCMCFLSLMPDEIIAAIEMKSKIKKIIRELRKEYREVILYKYYHELTLDEIANLMNTSLNTIKTWHCRAKEEICKNLKPFIEL